MMDWTLHLITSFIVSVPLIFEGRLDEALPLIFVGVFMDIDHIVDYYIYSGRLTLFVSDLRTLADTNYYYCPLHSWELGFVYMLLFGIFYTFIPAVVPVLYGAAIGWFFHMIMDMLTNNMTVISLSLLYRQSTSWKKQCRM